LRDNDLHHLFQAGLVRGLNVGLLAYVPVVRKVLQPRVVRSVVPTDLEAIVGSQPIISS